MRNILARRGDFPPEPSACCSAIWFVDADESYSVERKRGVWKSGYVAVRTLTGEGGMRLFDGRELVLKPNSIAVLSATEIERYAARRESWQFYWFEFEMTQGSAPMLGQCERVMMSAQERADLDRAHAALSSGLKSECALADALLTVFLQTWKAKSADASGRAAVLQLVTGILEKSRGEKRSIGDMAREANMCERSFRDAVQEATGLSPKAYLLRGEMTAAMELLRTTSMPVSEIAACFNYASPLYFSRVFKKYYGLSPQRVRDGIEL